MISIISGDELDWPTGCGRGGRSRSAARSAWKRRASCRASCLQESPNEIARSVILSSKSVMFITCSTGTPWSLRNRRTRSSFTGRSGRGPHGPGPFTVGPQTYIVSGVPGRWETGPGLAAERVSEHERQHVALLRTVRRSAPLKPCPFEGDQVRFAGASRGGDHLIRPV